MLQYKTDHEILTCIRKKATLMQFKNTKMAESESLLIVITMLYTIRKDSIVLTSSLTSCE